MYNFQCKSGPSCLNTRYHYPVDKSLSSGQNVLVRLEYNLSGKSYPLFEQPGQEADSFPVSVLFLQFNISSLVVVFLNFSGEQRNLSMITIGTTSAQRGRTPLDPGTSTSMASE